jgi:hypothetical protein
MLKTKLLTMYLLMAIYGVLPVCFLMIIGSGNINWLEQSFLIKLLILAFTGLSIFVASRAYDLCDVVKINKAKDYFKVAFWSLFYSVNKISTVNK